MKKDSNCIICGNPKPSTLAIASYCVRCRGVVGNIHRGVTEAMRSQDIPPPTGLCVDCGRPATCYDHRYYSMPLEVDPVCSRCNTNRGPALDVVDLGRRALRIGVEIPEQAVKAESLPDRLKDTERQEIEHALRLNRWNRSATARSLGISFRAIRYKIKKLGIQA